MKISNTQTTQYKQCHRPNFRAIPICRGNVFIPTPSGKKELVPVKISILNAKDKSFIKSIQEEWAEATKYGANLIRAFLKRVDHPSGLVPNNRVLNYLMLTPETDQYLPKNKPLCLAEISRWNNLVDIELIQAAEEVTYPLRNRISGCGQIMMYAIAKIANSINCPELKFISSNDGFYRKIFNVPIDESDEYVKISRNTISQFIVKTQDKFDLFYDSKTLHRTKLAALEKYSFPSELPKES